MKRYKYLVALFTVLFVASAAFASVGLKEEGTMLGAATDIDVVGGLVTASGAYGGKTITVYPSIISVVAATPATIVSTVNGRTYIVDDGATRTTTFCASFTLPVAADGLIYTFVSGDGSGMTIRSSDSNYVAGGYSDVFEWGTNPGGVATAATLGTSLVLERGAVGATGTTVTVRGYVAGSVGKWYVSVQAGTIPTLRVRQRETNPVCEQ